MFAKMNTLRNKSTQLLIDELINDGIETTREYFTNLFNEHITQFNQFIKNCLTIQDDYTIENFYMGDSRITINMLCMNYDWSSTRTGSKKIYQSTHCYICLLDNKFKFFQFGQNVKENRIHQEWLDNLLSREYKFKQLKIN